MAHVDFFLKLDGIEGESTDKDHKGEIEIQSFSWGLTNTSDVSGGGGGAGKASFQDLHFTSSLSKASPQLMLACATGKHIKSGILIGRGGKDNQNFLKFEFSDILISSYQVGGESGDALPTDQFSLNFAKFTYNDASFDIAQNRVT